MIRTIACLLIGTASALMLGCGGSNETELMPEPTEEEMEELMDYEMEQEAEMEDPANR